MAIDETMSPSLQNMVTRLGTRLHGFDKARQTLRDIGYTFTTKRVERLTERIGAARVREREIVLQRYQQLTLTQRCEAPPGVTPPDAVCISFDGGRLQVTEASDKGTHWRQYNAGDLRVLESQLLAADPEPELPEVFRDQKRMCRLVAGVSHKISGTDAPEDPAESSRDQAAESRKTDALLSESSRRPEPSGTESSDPPPASPEPEPKARTKRINQPETVSREVLASRTKTVPQFGWLLAAYAWTMGFFQAARKGFVGDGSASIWDVWESHFKPRGFIPILDFIHGLTYVFNAAMAGRTTAAGWDTYVRWIEWVWQGQVEKVLAELEARQRELGPPLAEDPATHPRQVVARSLTYLRNQQSRMNYPEYRRQGLAITSCHIESTIKQLNFRVKGSEMFWSDAGAEALLQLSADLLSDSQPLNTFWSRRAKQMTGCRTYTRSVT